jgi:hypothetical protein
LNPDGAVKWTLETNGPISATPLLAEDGTPSREGRLRYQFSFDSSPTLAPAGTLYAASRTGEIAAFSTP